MPQFVLGQFTEFIAWTLDTLLSLYFWLIVISALLSWVNPDPRNPIVRLLYGVTEPVLYDIRGRLPFVVAGGFDLATLVLLRGIQLTKVLAAKALDDVDGRLPGG